MRIVTWNMAYWSHRSHHKAAWRWVFEELQPDVFLCQESLLPDGLDRDYRVVWNRAYPGGQQPWGTGIVTKHHCTPVRVPSLDEWFQALPAKLPGKDELTRINCADGWLASALVELPVLGQVMVGSVHSPSFPIEKSRLDGIDISEMKLKKNPDLWFSDILFYFLRPLLGSKLLVGGDLNASRLLDTTLGERGNNEFFDRIKEEGFASVHRLFHEADEQTYYKKDKGPHQLDYIFVDAPLVPFARSCSVQPPQPFSDHAALIADFGTD